MLFASAAQTNNMNKKYYTQVSIQKMTKNKNKSNKNINKILHLHSSLLKHALQTKRKKTTKSAQEFENSTVVYDKPKNISLDML